MTVFAESRISAASIEEVFDLVADVESYPTFLPLWRDARIYERSGNVYYAEQAIGLGPLEQRFQTKTILWPPLHIEVTSTDPLFREFYIRWDFANVGRGYRISVAMQWLLSSPALQEGIDRLLPSAARTIVRAFEMHAHHKFGG